MEVTKTTLAINRRVAL